MYLTIGVVTGVLERHRSPNPVVCDGLIGIEDDRVPLSDIDIEATDSVCNMVYAIDL